MRGGDDGREGVRGGGWQDGVGGRGNKDRTHLRCRDLCNVIAV